MARTGSFGDNERVGTHADLLDSECVPPTIHTPDLFFAPSMNSRANPAYSQIPQSFPISNQLYPYHQQGFRYYQQQYPPPSVPLPQIPSHPQPPPPLPPKPVEYPATISAPPLPPKLSNPVDSPDNDSNELAMALALSQSESARRKKLEEQEEADLARALAESMKSAGSVSPSSTLPFKSPNNAISSPPDSPHLPSCTTPPRLEAGSNYSSSEIGRHRLQPPDTGNVSSIRPLSIASTSSLPYALPTPPSSTFPVNKLSSQPLDPASSDPSASSDSADSLRLSVDTILVFDDESYARQLAAEEEELAKEARYPSSEKGTIKPSDDIEELPLYTTYSKHDSQPSDNRASSSELYHQQAHRRLSSKSLSVYSAPPPVIPRSYSTSNTLPPAFLRVANPQASSSPDHSSAISFSSVPVSHPSLSKRREVESDVLSDSSHHSSSGPSSVIPPTSQLNSEHETSRSDVRHPLLPGRSSSAPTVDSHSGNAYHAPAAGVLNVNHFLDRELLLGVSIGFNAPTISTKLLPMTQQMPNIISLPYSRCPPLHFHAPDWQHLLRLMARLSTTRIEPTVEAMAISKSDLKLRTVVQFVKPNLRFNEWRAILWFTIDHPVPQNAPGASRYLSGNPNLLPWSYTLSPVPMLLRDATDTNVSKTYTIPASDSVPLPNLPITFPNLALYLQAALDASRQYSSDGTSGYGKLGKIVQMCYPNSEKPEFDIPEKSSVSHLFKRVIGRGDKKKGKITNNEETYQLVTPFITDEWG